jgi:uncharacterized protein YndB with AHSA1/START domain
MASNRPPERILPFSNWWPVIYGALTGVVLRLIFLGVPGHAYSAMGLGLVVLGPIAAGAVTVYVAELGGRRALGYHAAASLTATALYVIGSLVILIEGIICAILIVPLLALLGLVGGLIMLLVCRLTNWPTQTLGCIVALPLALGAVEGYLPLPDNVLEVRRGVTIDAPPEAVWRELIDARDIRSSEVDGAWLFRMGVPVPLEGAMLDGHTLDTPMPTRRVRMAKNVYFDEIVTEAHPNEAISWGYRFYPDSFPPYALDEHIRVGGLYFDVLDTSYSLTRHGDATDVDLRMHVRVSTRFNWYANPLARWLIGNLEEWNLGYYKRRSEGVHG